LSALLHRLGLEYKKPETTGRGLDARNGLRFVLTVVRIEQTQLLAAMHDVERVVDVERDPFGNAGEGLAIEIDHRASHPQQGTNVRQVLQP